MRMKQQSGHVGETAKNVVCVKNGTVIQKKHGSYYITHQNSLVYFSMSHLLFHTYATIRDEFR